MKELLAQAKVHFSLGESSQKRPCRSHSVDTIYGEYGVDVYESTVPSQEPPLVIELGLGRRKESALAKKIVEKLVDPSRSTFVFQAAQQSRNLEYSVAGQLAAMHKLRIDEYDSIGMSFGGYETLARARVAGARALHVVTVAAVGELIGGSRAYVRALPGLLRSGGDPALERSMKIGPLARTMGEHGLWLASCAVHPQNTLAQLAIICQSSLLRVASELSTSTHLTMVVGGLDSVAGPVGADEVVQIHNERAGIGMAQRVLVRNISHGLTSACDTLGYITQAVLRGDSLQSEMDLVKSTNDSYELPVESQLVNSEYYGNNGFAIAG